MQFRQSPFAKTAAPYSIDADEGSHQACRAKKGTLANTRPDELAAVALKEAIKRAGVDPKEVEDVILGCAMPEGEQGMNIARLSALLAGLPDSTGGVTINRFCSSGLQSIAMAAQAVMTGMNE